MAAEEEPKVHAAPTNEPVEGESLDSAGADISTGSLFKGDDPVETAETEPYKLDINKGAIKNTLFMVGAVVFVLMVVLLLFKNELEENAGIMTLSLFSR